MRQTWSILTLALILALALADVGSASSVVFTKGGNVWRSSADGRHQSKLTRDGGYSSPSQDDRGRVYAIQRGRFVRLTARGRRIGAPPGRRRCHRTAAGLPTGAASSGSTPQSGG